MKDKLLRFLSSYRATLIFLSIYAIVLALATFVERDFGTPVAKAIIYYSPLFILLHILMLINFVCITVNRKLFKLKRWGYIIVHFSFMVILAGAMITHVFSEEGMIHLRKGERTDMMLMKDKDTQTAHQLPFEVELLDFKLTRYPGSQSPSSYESYLRLYVDGTTTDHKVYMNNVLDIKGYRFFQASYDQDELGSILSVNRDVTGRTITYIGYALLFLGLGACLLDKHTRFRILIKELNNIRVVLLFGLLSFPLITNAQTIPTEHTEKFGAIPMQANNGRIVPINTFASEILRKINKEKEIEGMTPEQFLLDLISSPKKWAHKPFIKIDKKEFGLFYTLPNGYMAYTDAFDKNGFYRFGKDLELAYRKVPAERSVIEKELIKLDEKINVLHQIFNYQLLRIFPDNDHKEDKWYAAGDDLSSFCEADSSKIVTLFHNYLEEVNNAKITNNWTTADAALSAINRFQIEHNTGLDISPQRMEVEIKYNNLNLFHHSQKGYLIIGGLLLVFSIILMMKREIKPWQKIVKAILSVLVLVFFLLQTYSIGMRWYIAGHAPWSNSYETMVLLAWVSVFGGLIFAKKNFMAFALATLFGGVVLFVSSLNWMDPQINPLVPVLKSPWLMFHVATLMAAYGFFGISTMIGTTNLVMLSCRTKTNKEFLNTRIHQLSIINEMSLIIGLALMTIGIFLGAIWANESWGRYWSWDPKETWALITMIVYAVVLHYRWFSKKSDLLFNLFSQLAFLAVLMTYFGVNYLLSGMHSYGNSDGLSSLPMYVYVIIAGFFVIPGTVALIKNRQ